MGFAFYISMDVEQIAEKCWNSRCGEIIIANGRLKVLLDQAKQKGGFIKINHQEWLKAAPGDRFLLTIPDWKRN